MSNSTEDPGRLASPLTEQLGAARDRPKWILYDRTESLAQSVASDMVTLCVTLVCIWFSQLMGGGVWEFVTLMMFMAWLSCRMPWERITRTTKLHTKAEAKAWAESLPDDGA